jgi:hypothetical protein
MVFWWTNDDCKKSEEARMTGFGVDEVANS